MAMRSFGIRTRVAIVAAIVTVQLLSLVGTLGYLSAIEATRQSQVRLLEERIDAVETQLSAGGPRLVSQLGLDTSLIVIGEGQRIPDEVPATLQVVRASTHPEVEAIVGVVSTRQLDETFDAIRTGLFASILATGLITGAVAWAVVDRSLRPVRTLIEQARAIEHDNSEPLLTADTSADELADLAETFNGMISRLRAADLDRRRFVSDASHELRTPLMVLSADADYELSHRDPDNEFALSVQTQADRLAGLVDDLLTLAAIDEGRPVRADEAAVADVLRAANAHDLLIDGHEHLDVIVPDVSRSVGNVVSNARRYGKRTVAVSLEAHPSEGLLTIHVDDDGPGVPPEFREQIFRRFARLDDSRARSDGGAGLGLSIARADVQRVDGKIRVDDSVLGGTRFSVTVPLVNS